METINKETLKEILKSVYDILSEQKEYLIDLDASMGDGDLGLTMTKGFKALCDEIDNIDSDDMGAVLMKLGMKMNTTVPSTMGTLISICLLKSAKVVKGKVDIELSDMVEMGKAAVLGVSERGKANVGDRTMLDALNPAVEALESSLNSQFSLKEAFENAALNAEKGVEATKNIEPKFGRAAYYSGKILGLPDPGAVAIKFVFVGIANHFEKIA